MKPVWASIPPVRGTMYKSKLPASHQCIYPRLFHIPTLRCPIVGAAEIVRTGTPLGHGASYTHLTSYGTSSLRNQSLSEVQTSSTRAETAYCIISRS
jgi:hypothetical protein